MMGSMLSRALPGSPRATLFWASVMRSGMGQTMRSTSVSLRVMIISVPSWTVVRSTLPLRLLIVPFFLSTIGFGGMTVVSTLNGSLTSQRSPPLKMSAWPKAGRVAPSAAAARRRRGNGRMA